MISLLFLAAALGAAAQPLTPPPQEPHFTRPPQFSNSQPLWVPAAAAITKDGEFREDLFSASSRAAHSAQVFVSPDAKLSSLSETDCQVATTVFGQFPEAGPDESLSDLARSAQRIASGTVRSSTVGFLDGMAGTLLEFVPDNEIKGRFTKPVVFIFYPYARFRQGRVTVCRNDLRYTLQPKIGDRLLFFALYPARDEGDSLFSPGPTHVMIKGADDRVSTTRIYKDAATPSSFEEVLDRVRRQVHVEIR